MVRRICGLGLIVLCALPFNARFGTASLTNGQTTSSAAVAAVTDLAARAPYDAAPWRLRSAAHCKNVSSSAAARQAPGRPAAASDAWAPPLLDSNSSLALSLDAIIRI